MYYFFKKSFSLVIYFSLLFGISSFASSNYTVSKKTNPFKSLSESESFDVNSSDPSTSDSSDSSYQEYSYDELLDQIKTHQRKYVKKKSQSPWDQVNLYPGFGVIQSVTQIKQEGIDLYYQNGLQISIGMELFSPHWYSETAYRNFGVTKSNSYELSLKELDFKIGHKNLLTSVLEYRFALGISTRNIRLTNEVTHFHEENKNPALITNFGIFSKLSPSSILIGIEADNRNVLVSSPIDKGSFGLNFLIMGYF